LRVTEEEREEARDEGREVDLEVLAPVGEEARKLEREEGRETEEGRDIEVRDEEREEGRADLGSVTDVTVETLERREVAEAEVPRAEAKLLLRDRDTEEGREVAADEARTLLRVRERPTRTVEGSEVVEAETGLTEDLRLLTVSALAAFLTTCFLALVVLEAFLAGAGAGAGTSVTD
jgi:hypothetical protein